MQQNLPIIIRQFNYGKNSFLVLILALGNPDGLYVGLEAQEGNCSNREPAKNWSLQNMRYYNSSILFDNFLSGTNRSESISSVVIDATAACDII